jgi:hypothetical protein
VFAQKILVARPFVEASLNPRSPSRELLAFQNYKSLRL